MLLQCGASWLQSELSQTAGTFEERLHPFVITHEISRRNTFGSVKTVNACVFNKAFDYSTGVHSFEALPPPS